MLENLITPDVSKRICDHMNTDHKDALVSYATYYGGFNKPNKVIMTTITSTAIHLLVDGIKAKIDFDHFVKDSSDAHKKLVSMLKSIK
tara:strand:- start:513 stop:776 length:264 start_codon:yes stop_codon:yes gene_type:complete